MQLDLRSEVSDWVDVWVLVKKKGDGDGCVAIVTVVTAMIAK